jgi:Flp pilus assembly protein TadD
LPSKQNLSTKQEKIMQKAQKVETEIKIYQNFLMTTEALSFRRLPEKNVPSHAGFKSLFKALKQAHSLAMSLF